MTYLVHKGSAAQIAFLLLVASFASGCFGGEALPDRTGAAPGRWSMGDAATPRLLEALGDPATSGLNAWPGQLDNAPHAYDIDGDGRREVIAHSTDRFVYVFDAESGTVLAKLPTKYPPAWHIERVLNGVQAASLRPGEPTSLVVTNHAAYVAVWTFDPLASSADRFVFQKQWETRMDACHPSPGMDAEAALGDMDGDGTLEIVVQTEEMGFFALNADGATRWGKCWAGGNSAPLIDDLEDDGRMEVIVASDDGSIAVLDGDLGRPLWTFNARDPAYGIAPASVPVRPTVADLDGVMPKEILFTARHAPSDDETQFASFHMAIFAIRRNPETYQGELVWMRQPEWANPLSYTVLVVNDVDGDGAADIFGMDWNTIGHRPGNWERLGPAHVFRLDSMGQDVWVREIDAWWSNQDILLSDSDGDGLIDVLVNGPGDSGDGLWRLSAATGAAEGFLGLAPWKTLRGPVLIEADGGRMMRLLVAATPMEGSNEHGTILVVELPDATMAQ